MKSVQLVVLIVLGLYFIHQSISLAVISIDLGSEWMKIAIVKPGVPMDIVLNKESRRKTPVVVSMKNDDRLFGDAALGVSVRYPASAYLYLQDLLAKTLDNPIVQTYQKRFPFYNIKADNTTGTLVFQHDEETVYSPEELLSMILNKARDYAEEVAEHPVKDIVLTVPAYFNQAERRAVIYAAELSGLHVLQLINDNAAVALNYGVFRRKEFNKTVQNIMFFDMGATSTTATIVGYQLAKSKDHGVTETNPHMFIKGVGFDRGLGGLEIDIRLRDHLAKLFTENVKTKGNVKNSPRGMAKLLKEAKRLKKVLSANLDHMSQVEGVLEDKDFRAKVTRAELEEMCADLWERVEGPITMALRAAEMNLDDITQVILVGGGTRVPKVQDLLLKATGKAELGKNINADEASALGAVYQAAHLSKGFKVKKFIIREANLYPIMVEFSRLVIEEDSAPTTKVVRRTLFSRNNPYPQKKVMTFNRMTGDFKFFINYANLENIIPKNYSSIFGSLNLSRVDLSGVAEQLEKNADAESKGIKAHFRMDESGILNLDRVESVFEKIVDKAENETEDSPSAFARLGSTIRDFFSGSKMDDEDSDGKVEDKQDTEEPSKAEEQTLEDESNEVKTEEGHDAEAETSEAEADEETEASDETEDDEEAEAVEETEASEETEADEEASEEVDIGENAEAGEEADIVENAEVEQEAEQNEETEPIESNELDGEEDDVNDEPVTTEDQGETKKKKVPTATLR